MAGPEAAEPAAAPAEPQSRNVVYCGGKSSTPPQLPLHQLLTTTKFAHYLLRYKRNTQSPLAYRDNLLDEEVVLRIWWHGQKVPGLAPKSQSAYV